jgi:hypothetical protein
MLPERIDFHHSHEVVRLALEYPLHGNADTGIGKELCGSAYGAGLQNAWHSSYNIKTPILRQRIINNFLHIGFLSSIQLNWVNIDAGI